MIKALALALAVVLAAVGIFVGIYGFERLLLDFWPPDASRVGPNIVASLVLAVLLVAHNEFVVERRAAARHESVKQTLRDEIAAANPIEEEEAEIAEQVEQQWRHDVLDRLDPTTPGGIGELVPKK